MSRILPILFNTDMVLAILDGRKTATRRSIKGNIVLRSDMEHKVTFLPHKPRKERGREIKSIKYFTVESFVEYEAPYQPGDILYVRETWCNANKAGVEPDFYYLADTYICEDYDRTEWKWRPSIHMPKKAARIWLKVKDVRAERLHDMTLDDFLSEGVVIRPEAFNDPENAFMQARSEFTRIWNSNIPKKNLDLYGLEANPWVWVIEFERYKKTEESRNDD